MRRKTQQRSHSKISKLPASVREAVDKLILSGKTYDEIAEHLHHMGEDISRASVGRYGQRFLAQMEKLQLFRDQARAVVDSAGDRPALEIAEAANQMALSAVMEYIMEIDSLKGAKATEVIKALALLERSGVQRERLKLEARKKANEITKRWKKARNNGSVISRNTGYIKGSMVYILNALKKAFKCFLTKGGTMGAKMQPLIPLLPYQQRWVEDKSRFKLVNKARQTGFSFAVSLEVLLDALERKTLWVLLSKGERQSRELMDKVQMHAKAASYALDVIEADFKVGKDSYKQLELNLPNGSRIIALPPILTRPAAFPAMSSLTSLLFTLTQRRSGQRYIRLLPADTSCA